MRLIDADLLSKEINSLQVTITGLRAGKGVITECMNRYGDSVLRTIDEQPTAYDIGKVVEELKERQKEYLSGFGVHDDNEMYGIACGLGDAIEIVKRGGVQNGN